MILFLPLCSIFFFFFQFFSVSSSNSSCNSFVLFEKMLKSKRIGLCIQFFVLSASFRNKKWIKRKKAMINDVTRRVLDVKE